MEAEFFTHFLVFLLQLVCLCRTANAFVTVAYAKDNLQAQDVPSLISSKGYPVEIHQLTTDDGYILEMHRIPYGRQNTSFSAIKPIAFMVHCLLCTSAVWVMQGPRQGLGYMLADNGFDVWMVNVRGTSYSKRHVKYTNKSKKFWEFSWHEMAIYDIPSSLDYVLNYTKQEKVNYVGFSMGTTIFFACMSYRPEYNHKVNKMVALAPAVYLKHARGLLLDLSVMVDKIEKYFESRNELEVPPQNWNLNNRFSTFCDSSNRLLFLYCVKVFRLIAEIPVQGLQDNLKYYLQMMPDTSSIRTIIHFYQVKNSNVFQLFNYGKKKNLEMYNMQQPPAYNLSQVTTPVYMFMSTGDQTTPFEDARYLKSQLPNVPLTFKVDSPVFSHAHYIWGNDVEELLYSKVVKILKEKCPFNKCAKNVG